MSKYINCFNEETKPKNFYLNKNNNCYEPCYEKCATCEYGGNGIENNCTSCESNYIFIPDLINSNNCFLKCKYYYYYNDYDQYRCTTTNECPEKYNILIKEKRKCTDDCTKDNIFKYYYNGECLKKCPTNTEDNNDYICKDKYLNKCLLTENELNIINENITENYIEKIVLKFIKDFSYSENHVSIYKNNFNLIAIYKNKDCVSNLNLTISEIDLGVCYMKIQQNYKIDNNLIIVIVNKKINNLNKYSIFNPNTGTEILPDGICKNETIIIKENILNKLNENNNIDIDSVLSLTGQNIDIFNKSSEFYNDICFHFDPPINKDITLKDRILLYYPNITLCEDYCIIKGVNLTTLTTICECPINNHMNKNNLLGENLNNIINEGVLADNVLYQSSIEDIRNILNNINIEILKCYKDVLVYKYFKENIGGFIILLLILIEITMTIIYYIKSLYILRKFFFDITHKYFLYLSFQNNNKKIINSSFNEINNNSNNNNLMKNGPPKKKRIKKQNISKTKKKTGKESIKFNNLLNISNKKDNTSLKISNSIEINNSSNNILNVSNYKKSDHSKNIQSSILNNSITSNQKCSSYNGQTKIFENQDFNSNLFLTFKNNLDINIEEYIRTDFNNADYEDAKKSDNRKFCEFLLNKLKINQITLNTFYTVDLLRPKTIKILLFILDIDLYFLINGLFFNETHISEALHSSEDESLYDFILRIYDNCFYTALAGVIINYIIDFFFVEEKKIKGILKREKNNLFILNYEIMKLLNNIINRYKYFIIMCFVITIFTWYYVTCFNNVYPFIKFDWIKTSIIIIIIMQILSILNCLFETIFRFISFKCKSEKFYRISQYFS